MDRREFITAMPMLLAGCGAGTETDMEYELRSSPLRNVTPSERFEFGNWTPVLTCASPGDLSVSYSAQLGRWFRIGPLVHMELRIETSSFTHSTAAGVVQITGVPFSSPVLSNNFITDGSLAFNGITKANYTQFTLNMQPVWSGITGLIIIQASGQGQSYTPVLIGDMPSGGAPILRGQLWYFAQ